VRSSPRRRLALFALLLIWVPLACSESDPEAESASPQPPTSAVMSTTTTSPKLRVVQAAFACAEMLPSFASVSRQSTEIQAAQGAGRDIGLIRQEISTFSDLVDTLLNDATACSSARAVDVVESANTRTVSVAPQECVAYADSLTELMPIFVASFRSTSEGGPAVTPAPDTVRLGELDRTQCEAVLNDQAALERIALASE
jgi:hypothetical protein